MPGGEKYRNGKNLKASIHIEYSLSIGLKVINSIIDLLINSQIDEFSLRVLLNYYESNSE